VTALGYAVVDLETSGFQPPAGEIVEIAVVHVDSAGQVTGSWDSLVRPGGGVGATWVHGVTVGMVRDAPAFEAVAEALHALLAGRVVVAHNLGFDGKFLVSQFAAAGLSSPEIQDGVCTLRLAQAYLPGPPHKLANCCEHLGIELTNAHAALGDAMATAELLAYFIKRGVPIRGTPVRQQVGVPEQRSATGELFLSRRG
jgi:DNA polymerase III epsilon subunit-like protein